MKKVFIFSPYLIFPVISASQKDIHGHILLFQKLGYEVTLVCYFDGDIDTNKLKGYEREHSIQILPLRTGEPFVDNRYTRHYQARIHFDKEQVTRLQAEVEYRKPDVLFFEYARFAYLAEILNTGDATVIFRSHNFELMHNYEKVNLNREKGFLSWFSLLKSSWKRWRSIHANEKLMFKRSKKVLSISCDDVRSFRHWYGMDNVIYFPPYLPSIEPHRVTNKKILDVVYMGSNFRNNVNYSGAMYLLYKIIKRMDVEQSRQFRFHFTGNNPECLGGYDTLENVKVHGFVKEIDAFLDGMDISCLPVKAGRGCKIKMFESLKKGIPTIGFEKTFSGIPFKENCFETAETPEGFILALEKMRSYHHRKMLSTNGRRHISEIAGEALLFATLNEVLST